VLLENVQQILSFGKIKLIHVNRFVFQKMDGLKSQNIHSLQGPVKMFMDLEITLVLVFILVQLIPALGNLQLISVNKFVFLKTDGLKLMQGKRQ
jgi:hypothetical protein